MVRLLGLEISQWTLLLLAGDLGVFCLSVPVGWLFSGRIDNEVAIFISLNKINLLLMGLTYILVLYVANLYDHYQDFRRRENISRVILSSLLGTLLFVMLFYLPRWCLLPRNFIEWHAVSFVWLLALWRYFFSASALPLRLQRNVLIIGAGRSGRETLQAIHQCRNSGLVATGFLDDDPKKVGTTIEGLPVLGDSGALEELIRQYQIGLVVVAITHEKSPVLLSSLARVFFTGVQLIDMPSLYEFLMGKIPTDHISDVWLFLHNLNKSMVYYRHFKRLMDMALASLGLLLSWPLLALVTAVIKLDNPGPALFRQERLGQDGRPFQIIKFRTMYQDAESRGRSFACHNDPRFTRVGWVLRRLRLDELPQLFNILTGEMSFIGPRPERQVFIREFQELVPDMRARRRSTDPEGYPVLCGYRERLQHYSYRLLVKPGITGWAQVMYHYAGSLEETRKKLQYDLYYIKNMGLLLDLAILLKTIHIVLFRRGR